MTEAGHRREGDEAAEIGQFALQFLHHLLDQEVAERDAFQALLAIADAVEDGGVRLALGGLAAVGEQMLDVVGHALAQRHLDEDQRLIADGRVEEGVAAAVLGIETSAQVAPVLDGMHRLIADDLLQHRRGGVPVDGLQHQKAAIEPGGEQMCEVGVQRFELRVLLDDLEQVGAHAHDFIGAAGAQVQTAQQRLAPGFAGGEQRAQVGVVGGFTIGRIGGVNARFIGGVVLGQHMEEGEALLVVQLLIILKRPLGHHDARGFTAALGEVVAALGQAGEGGVFITGAWREADLLAGTLADMGQQILQKTQIDVHGGLPQGARREAVVAGSYPLLSMASEE